MISQTPDWSPAGWKRWQGKSPASLWIAVRCAKQVKHWLGIIVENMPKTIPLHRGRQHGTSSMMWSTAPMGVGYDIQCENIEQE